MIESPGRTRRRGVLRPLVAVGAVILLVALAGCSKSVSPKTPKSSAPAPTTSATAPASSAAASTSPVSSSAAPTYNVSVTNFTYHGMPSTVPANQVFHVSFTNKEKFPILHEFVVVEIPKGKTAADIVADTKKKGPKGEDDWIHVGDSGDPLPVGGSAVITMDLAPGNYMAGCWQTGKAGGGSGPPHVAIGMHTQFTAVAGATAPSATPAPTYNVTVTNFTYHGMPSTVPANQPFNVSFTNKEKFPILHEFVVVKVPKGKTAADIVADTKKKGPSGEDDWIHVGDSGDPLPVGGSHVITMDLAPGNYMAGCWQTGKAGGGSGPPHVVIGMHTQFTATAGATAPSATTAPTYTTSVTNFTYHGMPSTVPANQVFHVSFTNKEKFPILHEFVVVKIPKGKTAADIVADTKKKGPAGEDDWIHVGDSGDPLPVGGSTVITMDLAPGNYMAGCWQTGKAGGGSGPPHVAIGMHTQFTAQ